MDPLALAEAVHLDLPRSGLVRMAREVLALAAPCQVLVLEVPFLVLALKDLCQVLALEAPFQALALEVP